MVRQTGNVENASGLLTLYSVTRTYQLKSCEQLDAWLIFLSAPLGGLLSSTLLHPVLHSTCCLALPLPLNHHTNLIRQMGNMICLASSIIRMPAKHSDHALQSNNYRW